MNKLNRHILYVILPAIALLVFIFKSFFIHQFNLMMCTTYDGMKNNFTLVQYVQMPAKDGKFFHFDFMSYPFGDHVFTADNTPILSVMLRWINHNVLDISQYVVSIFNGYVIFHILLSSILAFYVFRPYITNRFFLISLSVCYPYLSNQIIRLFAGHYNLSFSSFFLIMFLLCRLYANAEKLNRRWILLFSMQIFTIFAFLNHGYYLPILGAFFIFYLFFQNILERRWVQSIVYPSIYSIITILVCLGIVWIVDPYFDLRSLKAAGFDFIEYKLIVSNLFNSYDFMALQVPVNDAINSVHMESNVFLGVYFFWSLIFLAVGVLISGSFRERFWEYNKSFFRQKYLLALSVSALMLLLMSMGNYMIFSVDVTGLKIFNNEVQYLSDKLLAYGSMLMLVIFAMYIAAKAFCDKEIGFNLKDRKLWIVVVTIALFSSFLVFSMSTKNILSPLYLASKITDAVYQFRCTGRFAWPAVLVMNVWLFYIVFHFLKNSGRKTRNMAVISLLLLVFSQTLSTSLEMRKGLNRQSVFSEDLREKMSFNAGISDYDTTLPIPFFHIGSEDYDNTIDEADHWSRWLYGFLYFNKMTTIASELSRTPPKYAAMCMELLSEPYKITELTQQLNGKNILVIVEKRYLEDPSSVEWVVGSGSSSPAHRAIVEQKKLLGMPELEKIGEMEGVEFYRWEYRLPGDEDIR